MDNNIGPIPSLNQEDYSDFYSFFRELETPPSVSTDNTIPNTKRQKLEESDASYNGDNQFEAILDTVFTNPLNDIRNTFWDFEFSEHKPLPSTSISFGFNNFENKPDIDSEIVREIRRQPDNFSTTVEDYPIDGSGSGGGGGGGGQTQHRRLWVKDRSKAWWDYYGSDDCPDEEFRRAFRMSKATFNFICDELDSAVTKKDTMLRSAIPVRQRVAVCIYRLATGDPLRLVSKQFGLGISTCHKLVLEGCAAIKHVLMPKFVQWPEGDKLKEIKEGFEGISGIPNVGGSIYTTHIPIVAPKVSAVAYFNKRHTERTRKPCYSITVQGVVDTRGVFRDICVGWPGSMSDEKILEKSTLFQKARSGISTFKDVWVVGNSGYPLMDWVLVPYTRQNLTWPQHSFNEKVNEIQGVAKDAFMKLKGRWTCLQKRTEVKLQDLPIVLGACCVLHNICEMRDEEIDMDLRFDLFDDEMVAAGHIAVSALAMQNRDNIAHNILHQK